MPEKPRNPSPAKAAVATKRPRDANGHFIKNGFRVSENKTVNDETLASLNKTNPLRKTTAILQQIKNKQPSVTDFRFIIVIIALPVFMLLAFSMGKSSGPACGRNTQTKLGLIYTLRAQNTNQPGIFAKTRQTIATDLPFLAPLLVASDQQVSSNRQILIQRDNVAFTIVNPNNVALTTYNTRQVFVTGKVNSCENTIGIDNDSDIQLLP